MNLKAFVLRILRRPAMLAPNHLQTTPNHLRPVSLDANKPTHTHTLSVSFSFSLSLCLSLSLPPSLSGPTDTQTVNPLFSLHTVHCEVQTCDAPLIVIRKLISPYLISTACLQAINYPNQFKE